MVSANLNILNNLSGPLADEEEKRRVFQGSSFMFVNPVRVCLGYPKAAHPTLAIHAEAMKLSFSVAMYIPGCGDLCLVFLI